jgi:hypothetical protein
MQERIRSLAFQVGDVLLDPRKALVWKDEEADVQFSGWSRSR